MKGGLVRRTGCPLRVRGRRTQVRRGPHRWLPVKAVSGAVGANRSATTGIGLDERSVGEAPVRHGGPDLRLRQVCRGWRKRRGRTVVLQGVDLDARAGTVSWIGGANGAGKTTLLRVAAGILTAEEGTVRFDGLEPERDRGAYQRAVGLVSAGDRGLYARVTVRRQLDMQGRLGFIPRSVRDERVSSAIREFGLTDLATARTDHLSLGQRQRVRLAVSLLHRPRLALLDEPANSLDDDGLGVLKSVIERITRTGGVVIWCSPPHEREVIPTDHGYLLESGTLRPA